MSPDLEKKLFEEYPKIFADTNKSPQESCMAFGLECDDGWYYLIDLLCEALTYTFTTAVEIDEEDGKRLGIEPSGWKEEEKDRYFFKVEAPQVVADQVKEKFGTLRFYVSGATDRHYNYIEFAELMSSKVCEECGAPGETYPIGWHQTLCEKHADERYGEQAAEYRNKTGVWADDEGDE